MDNSPDKASARSPSSEKQDGVDRVSGALVNSGLNLFDRLKPPTKNCQSEDAMPYRVSCLGSKLEQGSSSITGGLAILDNIEPYSIEADKRCPTQSHFEIVSGAVDQNVPIVAGYAVGETGSGDFVSNDKAEEVLTHLVAHHAELGIKAINLSFGRSFSFADINQITWKLGSPELKATQVTPQNLRRLQPQIIEAFERAAKDDSFIQKDLFAGYLRQAELINELATQGVVTLKNAGNNGGGKIEIQSLLSPAIISVGGMYRGKVHPNSANHSLVDTWEDYAHDREGKPECRVYGTSFSAPKAAEKVLRFSKLGYSPHAIKEALYVESQQSGSSDKSNAVVMPFVDEATVRAIQGASIGEARTAVKQSVKLLDSILSERVLPLVEKIESRNLPLVASYQLLNAVSQRTDHPVVSVGELSESLSLMQSVGTEGLARGIQKAEQLTPEQVKGKSFQDVVKFVLETKDSP